LAGGRGGEPLEGEKAQPVSWLTALELPQRFGDYELLEEVARGGMGIVFKARQLKLSRIVAFKVILAAPFADGQMRERFRLETEAMARLAHPNIVQIYETGLQNGLPYFSMEYVPGKNLAQLQVPLEPGRGAKYLRQAAEAIAHAHNQGVLHRDLKPSNLLLASDGTVRVSDFGLAKWLDADSDLTLTGQALGSPSYLSPEQALSPKTADAPATDVYALGAVLYYLLTGRAPFLGSTAAATVQQVIEQDPVAPRALNPKLPRDLETICLKCLEKEPAKRYASAGDLVEELGRFLEGHPIRARPVSPAGKAWRWCRRKPALAVMTGVALGSVLLGACGIGWELQREKRANLVLKRTAMNLDRTAMTLRVSRAEERFERGERSALALLTQVLRADPAHPVAGPRLLSALTWRNWPLPLRQVGPASAKIGLTSFSPTERFIAGACLDGSVWIWDEQNHVVTNSWPNGGTNWQYVGLAFSEDEKWLLALNQQNELLAGDFRGGVCFRQGSPTNPITTATWLPDSKGLVAGGSNGSNSFIAAWSFPEGKRLYSTEVPGITVPSFTPEGRWVSMAEPTNTVRVRETASGSVVASIAPGEIGPGGVLLGPDDSGLLLCLGNQQAAVWNWRTGRRLCIVPLTAEIRGAQFSLDGSRLALFTQAALTVCESATGKVLFDRRRPDTPVGESGVFPKDRLVVREDNWGVEVLEPATGVRLCEPLRSRWAFESLALSGNGRRLLASAWENTGLVWDLADGRAQGRSLSHQGGAGAFAFSPNGERLATGGKDNAGRLWDTRTWQEVTPPLMHTGPVAYVEFSHDGKRLVTASSDHTARVWDASNGQPATPPLALSGPLAQALFSPNGAVLATTTETGWLRFWDVGNGRPLTAETDVNQPEGVFWGNPRIFSAEFSADGRLLALACASSSAQVWDVATGRRLLRITQPAMVMEVRFSPDGRQLATACADGAVQLWDPVIGQPIGPTNELLGAALCVRFSPDGQKLVAGAQSGPVRVWSTATGQLLSETEPQSGLVYRACFSHSGGAFAAIAFNTEARVWDTETALPLTEKLTGIAKSPNRFGFSPDDRWLATAGFDDQVVLVPHFPQAGPVPLWLIELAEAVSGEGLDANGFIQSVPPDTFLALRRILQDRPGEDFYSRWVRWFLADREKRPRCPEL
jgi:WD40 repeat protein/tRNA A-37 threonylcarbamoyl transferase component Bud32